MSNDELPPETLFEKLGGNMSHDEIEEKLRLQDKIDDTASLNEVVTEDITVQSTEVAEAAKRDLNFLAPLAMPSVFQFNYPVVFLAVWTWLLSYVFKERVFPKLALGLPRGFGKTTLIKLFILFCVLFTKKKFILVTAATQKMAENIISDVADMLDEPNIKKVFGDWRLGIIRDTLGVKTFGFRGRNITLAAIGAGGSLRGLNLKHNRPDVMIFEDIQSREDADSEVISMALEQWMIGTAMKAKSPHGCMYLFVANMYPTKWSLLRRLKKNKMWTKFITGGILSDFTSLWEDLQPIEQLMEEFEADLEAGHPEIFYAEVLNDENASANNLIDLSKLPESAYTEGDIAGGNFVIIDPSNDKHNSDAVSIGYFEVHSALPHLMELTEDRLSPGDTIRVSLEYCLKNNCRLIVVEANAYQYSMLYWFNFICAQLGIQGIECVPIYSGSRSKNARILEMFKELRAGELFIESEAQPAAFVQITSFNPLRTDNTDGILDLLTYANRVMEEFAEYIAINTIIELQEQDALEVLEYNTNF